MNLLDKFHTKSIIFSMHRKSIFTLIGILFLFCGVAHADVTPLSFYKLWLTNVDQVTPSSDQNTFNPGETPYLYIEIKDPETAKAIASTSTILTWTWNDTTPPIVNGRLS